MRAEEIIATLGLQPHPEGGWYRQTWRSDVTDADGRPTGTAIHFLLQAGEVSHWHKVDAAEIWLYHAGAPLTLSMAADTNGPAVDHTLGADLQAGQAPQLIVPPHHWQAARAQGDWTLVSCTVSPGFSFDRWELAAPGFDIPR
ncbi:cupin superfamily protein [Ketogulonicigenium robustum]|uniref:Cupin superfamily protein n=1 Tax=Ketogulonicigenium robustum TaxID=92947 RepID=A0A1W6P0W6_9RHOB|nr:cupin domain-containing protein [Ketogulonicigenium robustum]ARO15053.1 cupin superfamily protein [Ketogulonicigenium robustum]